VVSLLVALVVALFLLPALAALLLPRHGARALDIGRARVERLVNGLTARPWLVVVTATVVTALAVTSLVGLGGELLPPADPRQFGLRIVGPPGQRVEATERTVEHVEAILREAAGPDLAGMLSEVGRLPEDHRVIREEQSEENTARIVVALAPGGRTAQQVVDAARSAVESLGPLEISGVVGSSALARALGTAGPPLAVEISGRSLDDLRGAAAGVAAALSQRPELWNVRSSFEGGPPELHVTIDRTLADGLGVSLDTVGATIESALDGRPVTTISTGDEEREVVLRLPRVGRAEILDLPLDTGAGVRTTVGAIARLSPEAGAREIFRRDQRRIARVTARVAPGAQYPEALAATRSALAGVEVPAGLTVRLGGEEAERVRAFGDLTFAGVLALVLVFMVLAGTFESLVHPLTVLAAVPLALIGVAAVLVPIGRPIGVLELLGLIVLAGVAVNDAILLVDAARDLMRDGVPVRDALARAAGLRLRPIVMTTVTSMLAILPLALGGGDAARVRSPMALTIVGGLAASLVTSLLVIPCVYVLLDRAGGVLRAPWRRARLRAAGPPIADRTT
jgi:HAE1 family hydrophobic/amphiphilic exporter-1